MQGGEAAASTDFTGNAGDSGHAEDGGHSGGRGKRSIDSIGKHAGIDQKGHYSQVPSLLTAE